MIHRCRHCLFGLFLFLLLCCCTLLSQETRQTETQASGTQTREFDLTGSQRWLDTGIDVKPGDSLEVTATGTLSYLSYKENGPEGLPRGWRDLLRIFPLSTANHGALIGRVGPEPSQPFLIGQALNSRATAAGRLFLGLNQTDGEQPDGSLHVKVGLVAGKETAASRAGNLAVLTQEMLDKLPTRVADAEGNLGDRVNFLIIGSEDTVKKALSDAGWVQVNRNVTEAIIEGALATFSKQAYTQLPMSELQLFGRPQDYGYAHADPLVVVAARHHFRIWKSPFEVDGQTLWVGAGTHDVGLERDRRNGGVTHKIDSDVDTERDYIGTTLQGTGEVARSLYMTPSQPIKEAKTATGGSFHSDGRTLVIVLTPEQKDAAAPSEK